MSSSNSSASRLSALMLCETSEEIVTSAVMLREIVGTYSLVLSAGYLGKD